MRFYKIFEGHWFFSFSVTCSPSLNKVDSIIIKIIIIIIKFLDLRLFKNAIVIIIMHVLDLAFWKLSKYRKLRYKYRSGGL